MADVKINAPFYSGTLLPQYQDGMSLKDYSDDVGRAFNDLLGKLNNLSNQLTAAINKKVDA